MKRPDFVGRGEVLDDISFTSFTSAELALIDSTVGSNNIYPYAYSATIAASSDSRKYRFDDQNILSDQKVGFGVFLTEDDEKGNLMFNVQGSMVLDKVDSGILVYPIFGRTNSTSVFSNKGSVSNILDAYTMLNSRGDGSNGTLCRYSFDTQVLGKADATGNVWCLAWVIENISGADRAVTLRCSLAIQKFDDNVDVYRPDRN